MGHSRGAVAAGLFTVDFYNKNKDDIKDKLSIEVVQFDPVPGYDNYLSLQKEKFKEK